MSATSKNPVPPAGGLPAKDGVTAQKAAVSVEFFPPKNEAGAAQMLATAEALRGRGIAFASVTCGAGGAAREHTLEYSALLQKAGYAVVPHLTCVGYSGEELVALADRVLDAGFAGVMALRGDPPKGETCFATRPDGLAHASELVELIRERERLRGAGRRLRIGVAGYPEKHPESPDEATDLRWLAHKVSRGADLVVTQLFFDNAVYFRFAARCAAAGICAPLTPGILPALSLAQARKFGAFGGAALPSELERRMLACGGDAEAERRVGVAWAHEQVRELLAGGAPGFHLYILNRAESALELFDLLATDDKTV
ncbi:MAG: methylenetetrahydrofolate reductase [Puniceicoccales bacterium]|jgi:methylenetetrahydrofolate reductase (NADPH)|nr:methylenetetrahydrofolate reductase [Puniceicoccales bacterium]